MSHQKGAAAILANVDAMLSELEAIYKGIHARPSEESS